MYKADFDGIHDVVFLLTFTYRIVASYGSFVEAEKQIWILQDQVMRTNPSIRSTTPVTLLSPKSILAKPNTRNQGTKVNPNKSRFFFGFLPK
jgi:hypothetical protein